ncbi:hypothetical protein BOO69_02705 [Sulfitobacter alexandrii]|uniref:Uncharacterized protein n=1 Tax=Sulfitobacter alexandrii TaxID=1917485 RepID=A0A1J0WE40_9RHOB|nr:hypothetical protein [Sulfitobacter alexandrii]APE42448.1 hypothetical protein BOO69_02705 [Sulfitobacter alexandrii]
MSAILEKRRFNSASYDYSKVGNIDLKWFEVPLLFNSAPSWPAALDPPSLHYSVRPYAPSKGAAVQPVLRDRLIVEPDVNLNDYRCYAEIDWIEIVLETTSVHQAVNVHRFASKALADMGSETSIYVSGPDGRSHYIGSAFTLRIQQPKPRTLTGLLKALVKKYVPGQTFIRNLPVSGIEVSVDFYVKERATRNLDAQNLWRWRMTDLLRRHLKPKDILTENEDCFPRHFSNQNGRATATYTVGRRGAQSGPRAAQLMRLGLPQELQQPLRLGNHNKAPIDTTSYIGAKEFPVMLRVMDKRTDRRDPNAGSVVNLPSDQWRSRVEVTLRTETGTVGVPAALGLATIANLKGFDFKDLRKLVFEFFLPTFSPEDPLGELPFSVNLTEEDVFARSGVYGLDRMHRSVEQILAARFRRSEIAAKPVKLGAKGRLVSYTALNNKVDRALRSMSRRWR